MTQYYLTREDYLAHHGILGQKWGKRNGPPYPLDETDHSQNEHESGYKKSLNGNTNEDLYDRKKRKGLTDEQKAKIKKAAIIGGAAVVAAIAAYGGYKLYKNRGMLRNYANLGKKNVDFIRKSGKFDYLDIKSEGLAGITDETVSQLSKDFGVNLKTSDTSIKEDIEFLYNNRVPGDNSDCGLLALDFFFRRAGMNVSTEELGIERKGGLSINELGAYVKGLNRKPLDTVGCKQTSDFISKIKESIIEQCGSDMSKECVGLIDLLPSSGGTGHFTSWYTENGEIYFTDIQSKGADISSRINYSGLSNIIVSRLDNCEVKGRNLFGSKVDSTIKAIIKNH